MNSGFPYRPPCNKDAPGAWPAASRKSGGCFQHWRSSEAHVQRYENTTRVVNWRCPTEYPGASTTIPPYERPEDGANCSGAAPLWGSEDWCNTAHTKPPCGLWSRAEFAAACASGETRMDTNCYSAASGESVNLARCQKVGFKNVQSRKFWHGMFGYQSSDNAFCTHGATPSQTKYLGLSRLLHMESTYERWTDAGGDPGVPTTLTDAFVYTAHMAQTTTVGRYTGVITPSGCSSYMHWDVTVGAPAGITDQQTVSPCIDTTLLGLTGFLACGGVIPGSEWAGKGVGDTVNISGSDFKIDALTIEDAHLLVELSFELEPVVGQDPVCNKCELTIDFQLSSEYTAEQLREDAIGLLEWWDMADDSIYPWRRDLYTTVGPLVSYDEVPTAVSPFVSGIDCNYLDENSYDAELRPDGYTGAILGKPLTGGYPDASTSVTGAAEYFYNKTYGSTCELYHLGATVTKVERFYWNGSAYALAHTGVKDTDWSQVTNEYGVTTVTILSDDPNLLACGVSVGTCGGDHPDYLEVTFNYDWLWGGHFDQRHVNYRWEGLDMHQVRYYGAWSGGTGTLDASDACQPRTATQWTSSLDAARFPHGAWAIMDKDLGPLYPGQGALWLQKYAEIKLPWKSQNWFGPCGKDRDVKTGYTCSEEPPCVQSGGTLAWPNAWPIEGDRGATFQDMGGGTIRVTLGSAADYLRDAAQNVAAGTGTSGDLVDFTTADGLTVLNNSGNGYEVTDTGSGWFEFSGTIPAAQYTRVKSHGAPGFWWYDTDGKGSYSVIRHTFDNRAYALANPPATEDPGTMAAIERDCLSFNRCNPAVMCFSPNYDEEDEDSIDRFEHGKTYNFGTIPVDTRYGSRWSGFFVQAMTDLWYKAPEVCSADEDEGCSGIGSFSEDEGGCTADDATHTYYPHRPMVECLEVMPPKWNGESDSLVPSLGLEEPTYTALSAVGPAERWTTPNPTPETQAPWVLWLNMQICICASGRWAENGTLTSAPGYKFTGYKNVLGAYMCGSEPT